MECVQMRRVLFFLALLLLLPSLSGCSGKPAAGLGDPVVPEGFKPASEVVLWSSEEETAKGTLYTKNGSSKAVSEDRVLRWLNEGDFLVWYMQVRNLEPQGKTGDGAPSEMAEKLKAVFGEWDAVCQAQSPGGVWLQPHKAPDGRFWIAVYDGTHVSGILCP